MRRYESLCSKRNVSRIHYVVYYTPQSLLIHRYCIRVLVVCLWQAERNWSILYKFYKSIKLHLHRYAINLAYGSRRWQSRRHNCSTSVCVVCVRVRERQWSTINKIIRVEMLRAFDGHDSFPFPGPRPRLWFIIFFSLELHFMIYSIIVIFWSTVYLSTLSGATTDVDV